MKHKYIFISAVLMLALIAGGWWWRSQARAATDGDSFEATGTIEARKVRLGAEFGGTVLEVLVEEGERVAAGQPLVKLDDAALSALRDRMDAEVRAAQANLALMKAGATAEQIQAAEAQLAQAEGNLRAAQAQLDALTGGTRPEEIAAIRANLERARSQYGALQVALTTDQIEEVRAALTKAESNLSAWSNRHVDLMQDSRNPAYTLDSAADAHADAQSALEMARLAYEAVQSEAEAYARQIELARLSWEVALTNLAQAQARLEALEGDERSTPEALDAAQKILQDARELVEKAEAAYQALISGISGPRLEAVWGEVQRAREDLAAAAVGGNPALSVETLLAQVDAATALRDLAAANLADLKNGARPEELQAARAQLDAAQAQLDMLEIELKKFTLASPWDGVVLTRSVEPGEIALPGGTLLEIGRLEQLELTAYLPEERFGQVVPGQEVQVRVDAYLERVFNGVVLRLAEEAEFTPTNVQTKEDRTRLVYAVVIQLDNPDLALKPGMIADVEFRQ
jgi:multidrug resistance efflux pump